MRLTSLLRDLEFGKLANVRGIISYKLSPFEQKAFAGAVSHGLPNIVRRVRSKIFIVVPPFVWGYLWYISDSQEYERLCRKNPDDYKNDK